ncbi:hypothetical protein IT397_01820 [Candidatus Nomurabacteria bacterium]|nr:hypothetical protein [Candidatus Nomurabacteria bacterium]
MLKKASDEYGFDKCGFRDGLEVAVQLVKRAKMSKEVCAGRPPMHVICTSIIEKVEGDPCDRVPMFWFWQGDGKSTHGRGSLACGSVELPPLGAMKHWENIEGYPMIDPETILLFSSVMK